MNAVKEATSTKESFTELYELYLPRVFRYTNYRVNNIQLAEDLTSATFEKALVNFSKYCRDKASFLTWLMTIARNVVTDYYRAKGRRQTVPLEEAAEISARDLSPEEGLLKRDELEKLQGCLSDLSQDEQEIIRLKFGAELNNRQIAKMLGLSESNVGTKLYRVVRKLRDSFQESENG